MDQLVIHPEGLRRIVGMPDVSIDFPRAVRLLLPDGEVATLQGKPTANEVKSSTFKGQIRAALDFVCGHLERRDARKVLRERSYFRPRFEWW